jgi:glycosidase
MIKGLYIWGFPIHINLLNKIDKQGIDYIHKGNVNLFVRYFYNFLVKEKLYFKRPPHFSEIIAFKIICEVYRYIIFEITEPKHRSFLFKSFKKTGLPFKALEEAIECFFFNFKPMELQREKLYLKKYEGKVIRKLIISEMLITRIMNENPACSDFNIFFNDESLMEKRSYINVIDSYKKTLSKEPIVDVFNKPLLEILYEPIKTYPDSLIKQLEYIKKRWLKYLPAHIVKTLEEIKAVIVEEESKKGIGGPGPVEVLEFKVVTKKQFSDTYDYPEYEAYTPDTDWMPNVVMIAKMVYVWLYQLSRQYHRPIKRLDEIPDEELDKLARWGFNALWLIGIWERSPASQKIKHLCGNIDAAGSAYSLYDYVIADELGGWEALDNLKRRAMERGIRLACDVVPNHMGIASKWVYEHPDWFLQIDFPPYPNYKYTGENLSNHPDYIIQIEDGYYTRTDAAVVFKLEELKTGRVRYIYHGNDGTSTPWNDTAQLNYLLSEVREAMINTIMNVTKHFSIIRFDAAMTLAKKHYQRLWFPLPGHGGGVPSRALFSMSKADFDKAMPKEFWREVVDVINEKAKDTLLIAEAFWLMEGYFVRTLGMHRVYNSAFMNMLKMEENAKYRQTIKNILEYDPRILQRFVNFMNNPDEQTAVEQFGKGDKYFGVAVLLVTMPGLPMFGHGQIEGFREKYGMEYKRAYYDEQPDYFFISQHEDKIFPLLRKRKLFSGAENFYFFDFVVSDGLVNENVFVYTNRYNNEKALIIYNNSYSTTKGRIKNSVKYVKRDSKGDLVYDSKNLGEALLLKNEFNVFYKLRDYNSSMEFLVNGKDIYEYGLEVEVRGYQYYAFLDFHEIYDSDGYIRKLYEKFGFNPIKSIDEEYKALKHEAFYKELRKLFFEALRDDKAYNENLKTNVINALNFFNISELDKLAQEIVTDFEKLMKDLAFFVEEKKGNYNQFTIIFVATLVFSKITSLYSSFEEFLNLTRTDHAVSKVVREFVESELIDGKFINLTHIIKLVFKYLGEGKALKFEEVIETLFSSVDKLIIGANVYKNEEWFNKELFETLTISLAMLYSLKLDELSKKEIYEKIGNILKIAEISNYKVKVFLKQYRKHLTSIV